MRRQNASDRIWPKIASWLSLTGVLYGHETEVARLDLKLGFLR
jgi:hypothetical protein